MEPLNSIGARLRAERERLGLSQSDVAALAARAGVRGATRQSQSIYEKDERAPDAQYLAVISAAHFDVGYVLTGRSTSYGKAAEVTQLTAQEAALLDNYRHSDETGKAALERTSAALAKSSEVKRSA